MTELAGHLAAVAWEVSAVSFIVLVTLTVRKARARGKRLFVDEPTARIKGALCRHPHGPQSGRDVDDRDQADAG